MAAWLTCRFGGDDIGGGGDDDDDDDDDDDEFCDVYFTAGASCL